MEKLVLDIHTGEAAEFDRVEALLSALAKNGGWEEVREGPRLIGLQGEHSSITLEPGSQLELSGQLCADLFWNFQGNSVPTSSVTAVIFRSISSTPSPPVTNLV
jgi:glutamate--cysteine ligase